MSGGRTVHRSGVVVALVLILLAGCTSHGSKATPPSRSSSSSSQIVVNIGGGKYPLGAKGSPVLVGFVDDGSPGPTHWDPPADTAGSFVGAQAAVQYANHYLNGLDGHVIRLDRCVELADTRNEGRCGARLLRDHVVAILATSLVFEAPIFRAVSGKIPLVELRSSFGPALGFSTDASPSQPHGYVLTNVMGSVAVGLARAKQAGIKRGAVLAEDNGLAIVIAQPWLGAYYAAAGVRLDQLTLFGNRTDLLRGLRAAIGAGDGAFTVIGRTTFVLRALTVLKELGFTGPVVTGLDPFPADAETQVARGGAITNTAVLTSDPTNPDVELYRAALHKYAPTARGVGVRDGYVVVLAFLRAVTSAGETNDVVTAASVKHDLDTMPRPVALPLGGGTLLRCNARAVAYFPGVCSTGVLVATTSRGKLGSYRPFATTGLLTKPTG